jgi:hypothetical protein
MAVVLFYMPGVNAFIKLLLIPLFGSSGVIVAFVPNDGRPVDTMTTNFVKALFSPNQYVYHRQGRKMSFSTVTVIKAPTVQKDGKVAEPTQTTNKNKHADNKEAQLRAFLMSSQGGVKNELDKKEDAFLKTFAAPVTIAKPNLVKPPAATMKTAPVLPRPAVLSTHPKAPIAQPVAKPQPAPAPVQAATNEPTPTPIQSGPAPESPETLAKKETQIEQELTQAKQEEAQPLEAPAHDAAHNKVATLEQQLLSIHAQKQQLEQEIAKLHTQLSQQKNPVPAPVTNPTATPPTAAQTPVQTAVQAPVAPVKQAIPIQDPHLVRVVPQSASTKKTDLPSVSDTPNVVVGIVKDPRGNVLSNILVEVKDREGNPVRAFKTNPLGQFASATPLSPGVYTLELEDPKKLQKFDVIQITANNQIMRPIEIISHDAREELRQQLFAN